MILTCCECNTDFEYREYNNENFVRRSLKRKNIVMNEQQFNELYGLA